MEWFQFVWSNYKETVQGQEVIRLFSEPDLEKIVRMCTNSTLVNEEGMIEFIDDLLIYSTSPSLPDSIDPDQADALFVSIVEQGITLTYEDGEEEIIEPVADELLYQIPAISTWLYLEYPDLFKPYFFRHRFDFLMKIADAFSLKIPPVPLKRQKKERLLYYLDVCGALNEFQEVYGLTGAELCAFLYGFAPAYLRKNEAVKQDLPEPTQVWWVGGDKGGNDFQFLDNAKPEDTSFWQGNEDTRRGDIVIMYCLSPRSYIHSIWRATGDGIADPFFHYYGNIFIGNGQKVPPITIHEMKADNHFATNPLVRKNLQGINGYPLSADDYRRLQDMLMLKGFDTSQLPQIFGHAYKPNSDISTEREVEKVLIEPLLERLGYTKDDWQRQLSRRIGSVERVIPDYVFLTDRTKGNEKASMIIESKFWIRNNRELEICFSQALSYGLILRAKILILIDKEALWIYERKDHVFDRSNYTKLFWAQLEDANAFNKLRRKLSKS